MTFKRNDKFNAGLRVEIGRRAVRAAEAVRDTARARMDAGGSGESYSGEPRRSSADGESPVNQRGTLSDSLTAYGPRIDDRKIEAAMGASADNNNYTIMWLEHGTARMAPRPLLFPSLIEARPLVLKAFAAKGAGDGA